MRRRDEDGRPARTGGLWFLPVSFAAGVAITALVHNWLWPRSPVVLRHEETKRVAATVPIDKAPPLGFYEMRVPWNGPPATRHSRSDTKSPRSRMVTSSSQRRRLMGVDANRVASLARTGLLESSSSTKSNAAVARVPAIVREDPPALNTAKDNTPFRWNLDLPNRGPSLPGSSNGTESESVTQTYEGTVMDAACVNSIRQSCSISSATTTFALRLDDGKTLPFDTVGNLRAQAKKKKSRWVSKTLAGKEIRAKVSGMVVGNELVAVSID